MPHAVVGTRSWIYFRKTIVWSNVFRTRWLLTLEQTAISHRYEFIIFIRCRVPFFLWLHRNSSEQSFHRLNVYFSIAMWWLAFSHCSFLSCVGVRALRRHRPFHSVIHTQSSCRSLSSVFYSLVLLVQLSIGIMFAWLISSCVAWIFLRLVTVADMMDIWNKAISICWCVSTQPQQMSEFVHRLRSQSIRSCDITFHIWCRFSSRLRAIFHFARVHSAHSLIFFQRISRERQLAKKTHIWFTSFRLTSQQRDPILTVQSSFHLPIIRNGCVSKGPRAPSIFKIGF